MKRLDAGEHKVCVVCQQPVGRRNNDMWECSHVDCPHRRRALSEGVSTKQVAENVVELPNVLEPLDWERTEKAKKRCNMCNMRATCTKLQGKTSTNCNTRNTAL